MTDAETAERLEGLLVPELIEWARATWPDEPAFAIGLAFTVGMDPTPAPGIGTLTEREDALAEPDEYGVGLVIWNPANYERYDPDFAPSDEATELAEALAENWTDDDAWIEFMGRIATRLATEDWGSLPRTDDFVIYATSAEVEEQAELEAELTRSVPKDKLDALRSRGLLHVTPPSDL